MSRRGLLASTLLFALVTSLVVTLASPASAGPLTPSKYRKAQKGVGNCIFSTSALPFEKEAQYKGLATEFSSGDVVHARCYFAAPLSSFEKKGKLKNELRDKKVYRSRVDVAPVKAKGKKAAAEVRPPALRSIRLFSAEGAEEWDQRDYNLDPKLARCLFPTPGMEEGCLDFDEAVRVLAEQERRAPPYSADVCLTTYVQTVEVQKGQAGLGAVEDVPAEEVIAHGCFRYTLSAPQDAPAPAPAPAETRE